MVVFMLRHLRPSVPFLVCSERLQRKFLKQALQLFGGGATSVRVQAILFIRQMAVALPPPTLSLAMKVHTASLLGQANSCRSASYRTPCPCIHTVFPCCSH